ncbi:LysR family transcriptional regulator [Agrobacterium leguminum]|uniref:LysR family transcriptional regulator n=1 Tax=Agrobacterium leguminum TaxID=2792015 RepID=UPI003CE45AE0
MDRLEAMSIFVAVVDAGSFAAAARKVGCSAASVTRAVAQLEDVAGIRLIERSTRHLRVTEAGQRHVESFRRVIEELALIDGRATDGGVRGTLVVTAPELFGRMHVLPLIESFLGQHSRANVRLLLQNRMMDLIGEGVDVGVRLAHLPDSSLTAVRLGEVRKIFCASPAYLAKHGHPTHPTDLAGHTCIGLNDQGQQDLWQYREEGHTRPTRSVRVNCQLSLNSAAAGIEAAQRDFGILHPISYQVQRQLNEGSLQSVLDDYTQPPMPVHLVFAARPRLNVLARAFVDHATPLLRDILRGRATL